jgi:protein-tyrosine-phosphatase
MPAMPPNKQIIVVCTGNTCRSPMGERLLAHALKAEASPLDKLKVISAGVSAAHGQPASPNSVKALNKVSLDLSDHKSRMLSPYLLEDTFAIFAMTESHRDYIEEMYREIELPPILLFRELMGDSPEVPDPFGADLGAYIETRDALAEAIPSILSWLRTKIS